MGIRYETASFSNLSIFKKDFFEVVISSMALMDSPNLDKVLKEIFKVLKSKGELIFSITHPCFATKGYGWINDQGKKDLKLTVANYFNAQPEIQYWSFGSKLLLKEDLKSFAVPSYPRTISEYLNTLIKTGFILKEVMEPRPDEEACKKYPGLKRWRDHAAIFFYIRAIKISEKNNKK